MEISTSPSSRQFPTRTPDVGLAEWTQKIKAMQRQVDADEEEEQRKLEQEIAASRLARVRRSSGYPSRSVTLDADSTPDDLHSIVDRQREQADALHKLSGTPSAPPVAEKPPARFAPSTSSRSEAVSLAAFIGGRATGPRLNKHAAQQDAHDPTQFEQRTRATITAPHPIFGRGGVAMPGLAAHSTREPAPSHRPPEVKASYSAEKDLTVRERKTSTSSAALRRYMDHVEQKVVEPQKTGGVGQAAPRVRTVSTPTGTSQSKPDSLRAVSPGLANFESRSPLPSPVPSFPSSVAATFISPSSTAKPFSYSSSAANSPPASHTSAPKQSASTPISSPNPQLISPSFSATSLAQPAQAVSKPSPITSPVPVKATSQAFLRMPTPKDPTPSISRLKGRGFVQSIVKASSELAASASSSSVSESGRLVSGKRLSSVADRWKPEPSSPQSQRKSWTPPAPLKTPPVQVFEARKSWTSPTPKAIEAQHTGKSVRKAPSIPALSTANDPPPSPGGRGMGSSSTMISYIKPMKTGDDPIPAPVRSVTPGARPSSSAGAHSRPVTPTASDYELGMRGSNARRDSAARLSSEPPSSVGGRPLSHLTKDRPKKPRKAKGASVTFQEPSQDVMARHSPESTSRPQPLAQGFSASPLVHASTDPSRKNVVQAASQVSQATQVKVGGVADRWADQSLIAVKPNLSTPSPSPAAPVPSKPGPGGLAGARALPGLATPSAPEPSRERSPRSPRKHSRIPSTGNRALVMDVAQVMNEQQNMLASSPEPSSPVLQLDMETAIKGLEEVANVIRSPSGPLHSPPLEKRKSSHDKYSAFVLPALKEEKTPASTPAATLARTVVTLVVDDVQAEKMLHAVLQPDADGTNDGQSRKEVSAFVEIRHDDQPLPVINLDKAISVASDIFLPDPNILTISVDVMSVAGATATNLMKDTHIFYESEVLAIIHRFKTKSSGLVANKVWAWYGKSSQLGEREEKKLRDLARQYGTTLDTVHQYCEPPEFVHVLGGQLAIRHGTRSHWSSENTTMHRVCSLHGNILIDEHDLGISNLCSAFSYCLTLLGNSYVWHGRGSLGPEREVARGYAQALSGAEAAVVELIEGESDDNELFWMMLGDKEYAKADYWKWRPAAANTNEYMPHLWRIDGAEQPKNITSLSTEPAFNSHLYVIDCIWEYFIVVGKEARGKRLDIRLALATVTELARQCNSRRPFAPPIHVVIMPSRIPSDLRLHFRDLDEDHLNAHDTPDHMNVITCSEAFDQLNTVHWDKATLKDPNMLPLGLHPSHLP
ncbi:hypothetical protein BV25DRAFT_1939502 [Artomyces pyxidatus]|uniref:Uncharacterized protein n=1 Tax=Artomyces pyxidatus TaxID=48021 RepID=A0ACB8T487_9AGAM|nr:hypothetical protein BV25DRAFT_1939502 [Artomyces pyxidatus]